jgi:hypothetical protein
MTIGDTREFFAAERITIIGNDNSASLSADILKVSVQDPKFGEIKPSIAFKDDWSSTTENFSGGGEYINNVTLSNLLDIPEGVVWDSDKETLTFKDNSIFQKDSTGCPLEGTDEVSLSSLSGDIEILTYFDKVNQFGKVYDFQFRKIEYGQYKFANTRICSAIASALGYLSVDKLINDEKVRMDRQNALYTLYKDDEEKKDLFKPYSGFLIDEKYLNEGWIDFDYLVYKFYENNNAYDGDASISIITKKFLEAKRALVMLCLSYSSDIVDLASFNKVTDFGVRVVDKTTGQLLDFSNFKNDLHAFYANSGIATFTGKLEYVSSTEQKTDAQCSPCTSIKVDKCTGEMSKVSKCSTTDTPDNVGVNHVLSPQFRLNPLIETRKNKPDILNTIDPIQWTTGTQNFTEAEFPGISDLREEFGEDALTVNRLNENRGFALGGGKDHTDGFVATGFYHQLDAVEEIASYGTRSSTEEWNGTTWSKLSTGDVPSPRGAGLGGGEKTFKAIAFGTKANFNPSTNLDVATPVPVSFTTNKSTSDTLVFADGAWYSLPESSNTNVPRHSVAGFLFSTYRATGADGKSVTGCNGGSTSQTSLSDLLGEDVQDDVNVALCPEVLAGASAFIRDAGARAAGQMTNTSLKTIGPAYDPNCLNGVGTSENDIPPTTGGLGFNLPDISVGGSIDCDGVSVSSDFSNTSTFAQDFVIPLCPSVSNKLPKLGNIFPGNILGLPTGVTVEPGHPVASWKDPIVMPDGSVVFKDDSATVDPGLLRTNSTGKPSNVDSGSYYEFWNLSGIAFNGSTGDMKLDGIVENELSDTFEFISWIRIHHHATIRKTPTTYKPYTFKFEQGCWNVDSSRKYPIKTVGTYYVGNECTGLATGGKTSNKLVGCDSNSASLNMKYGYFADARYNEFNNSIVNIAYENNGSAWIRRDNLPENVCYHVGVGNKDHALFWGGIHASLETPNVSVSFPGCEDWYQMISNFGGVFNRRGNIGLDKEVRYSFFGTQAVDSFGNHYFKAGDNRDPKKDGIVYSDAYIASGSETSLSGRDWESYTAAEPGHVYSVAYTGKNKDVDEPQTELDIIYFTHGESWVGEAVVAENLNNKNPALPYAERQAAAVLGVAGESETTDQVGDWIKTLLTSGFNSFEETWRPDTETNSFPLSGFWPKLYNYFLNGSDKRPVWKYSGHPVDGAMWVWSRPTPGEALFNPKNLHPEPIDSAEWQSLEKWKRHSFEHHSGLEYFYTKFDENYADLVDYSLEVPSSGNYKKTAYWVVDNFDANSDNTFTTLYDYDPFKIEKFLTDYAGVITYASWQNFLAQEGGRVRVRSEDTYFKHEYLRSVVADESLYTFHKNGKISSLNVASSGAHVVQLFTHSISSCLNISSYDLILSPTSTMPVYTVSQGNSGFTIHMSGAYTGDIAWKFDTDVVPAIAKAWCEDRKSYNEIAQGAGWYYEDNYVGDFRQYTAANIVKVIAKANEEGLIPKESLSDPLLIHVPEEALTLPIKDSFGNYRYYSPTPYDVSVYADIFADPAMNVPLNQLTLRDWSAISPISSGSWALPRYTLQNVLSRDSDGNIVQTVKKVLSYTKTATENPKDFFYSHNLASVLDSYNRRFYLPKVKEQFITDFNVDLDRTENGLLVTPELNKRYINKYFPDSILSNNLGCYTGTGLNIDGITYVDTGRYSSNVASCSGFAFRTNEDLASILSYGNNETILGGKFDMFWFNNVTRKATEINPSYQYKSGAEYDKSLSALAQAVYMPSRNQRGWDDFHYFYKVNTWSAQVSSANLAPNSASFWISGGYAPASSCQSVNTSAGDLNPPVSCYPTDTLTPSSSPITATTVDSISYQVSGGGYLFTASGRYISDYTTSQVAETSAGFAYHFGYERSLHDVSPITNLSDRFDQFDYFRYRFSDHDTNDWLYMPNVSGGEYNGGDALDDLGFATSTYAPSGITYSFYITRNCGGLDQLIWGRDKKTFVEKWKYPCADEVINALDVNSDYDGVGSIGTMTGDSSGNKTFTTIEDYSQFKWGTLSVGKFNYPVITKEQINVGVENPLKSIFKGITERQSDDVSVFGVSSSAASAAWEDFYSYMDAPIPDDNTEATNYFPLTYDTFQGNPAYLPQLPFFKVDEEETNVRFLPAANSSSIRDRATLWPWCDLLDGDARNEAGQGDVTWQFTVDGHFWIAETVAREWVTPKACKNVGANSDPLHRGITHTGMYPVGGYWRETFRIRRYDNRSQLVFDYRITYDEAAGPEIEAPKQIGSDFNMFGMNIKKKTIELNHFNNKPINGPTQTWVSELDESKSWLATNWNREEISNLRLGIEDIQPEVAGISATISELYNYRHESLCEMITGGYNKAVFVPSTGVFCEANQDSIWVYSVPFGEQAGALERESFFIEESPYVRTAVISGTDVGVDNLGDITENIRVINTPISYTCVAEFITGGTPYISGSSIYISGGTIVLSGGQECGAGSQIIHAKTYTNNGKTGMRMSRAIIAGPYSRGIGMLDYGKSQAFGKKLLHNGDRQPCTYKANENTTFHPSDSTIKKSWPWNIIGQGGTIGPKGFTDLIDGEGNYWFAMGEKYNYEEVEKASSANVNYKNSYVIGMVKASNLSEFMKTAIAKTNYLQAKQTLDAINLFAPGNNYTLYGTENTGSRFREGVLELVHASNGADIFELYVRIMEENVLDVNASNYVAKYKDISDYVMPKDGNGVIIDSTTLPLSALSFAPEVTKLQELQIVNETDPTCLECLTCASQTSDYATTVVNPTSWFQHNHDQWVAPFMESPFAGPYSVDGFNVWLTAGNAARWGTPLWSTVKDGKFWISYRRARIHANPYRGHVVLAFINASIAVEDFADATNNNIPVYVTYDEFLFDYEDYKNLNIIKEIVSNENLGALGRDCVDNLAAYVPIEYPEFEAFNTGATCFAPSAQWQSVYTLGTYTANISAFSQYPTSAWSCPGSITNYAVQQVPTSGASSFSLSNVHGCNNITSFSVAASAAALSGNFIYITTISSQVTGCSGIFTCPDNNPNERYTEWATSFVQEYKSRKFSDQSGVLRKYFFKYDVMNTYDSNTLLSLPNITEKKIVPNDWRRYQDGVGLGGDAPALNVYSDAEKACNALNQFYVGQTAFGSPQNAVVVGGYTVQTDGELTNSHCWWERTTTGTTFKWSKEVIAPEDSVNNNYKNRTFSPFFTNGENTLSSTTHGAIIFDLSKQVTIERQGIAQFENQKEFEVSFDSPIPDWAVNKDKYSITLMPDQNVKVWWDNKTESGFTIKVELESWTGSVDWQITLVDDIPSSEVDGLGTQETFDKFNNL